MPENTVLRHIVALTALRDHTAFATRLVEALSDLIPLHKTTFFRRYAGSNRDMLYPCAGLTDAGFFCNNVYLPEPAIFIESASDALWMKAIRQGKAVQETRDGMTRWVCPILFNKEPRYLMDLVFSGSPDEDELALTVDLSRYVTHHLSLIEYSETDTLTGLPNRKTFNEHLFRVLGHAHPDHPQDNSTLLRRRDPGKSGRHWLAVLDIDYFKRINDTYGHLIGDEVLVLITRLLRESTRLDNQLFRMGGEEFVILLQPTTQQDAEKVLNRLRERIGKQVFPQIGQVTLSGGYSCVQPYDAPDDILDRADEALYYAKGNGRNQIACYETLIEKGNIQKKALLNDDIELF